MRSAACAALTGRCTTRPRSPGSGKVSCYGLRWRDIDWTAGRVRVRRAWMGHRDFTTTLIYADYAPGEHEAELIERAFGTGAAVATSA